MIDQATATFRLKAMFDNEDEKLWPGEFVNARLLIETRRDVIAVPTAAVQRGPQGLFAWVVKPDGVVEPRPTWRPARPRAISPDRERASPRASAWSPTASTSCRSTRR